MSKEYPCVHWNNGKCKKFSDDNVTSWCVESPCEEQQPSNADRIRAMSDEEFSCFLALVENRKTGKTTFDNTSDFWLEWLKQPAEGE